jgi:hypothetical protein
MDDGPHREKKTSEKYLRNHDARIDQKHQQSDCQDASGFVTNSSQLHAPTIISIVMV